MILNFRLSELMGSSNYDFTCGLIAESALKGWTSLGLALQHGFSGGNTDEKFKTLTEDLKNVCLAGGEQHEIEDLLESAAYHDFNFLDEDKSFKDLARAVVTCLREVKTEDVAVVISRHFPSVADAITKSVGEDETELVDQDSALSEMMSDSTNLSDDIDKESKRKQEPVVDEDGFELVQPRRRKR